MRQRLITGIIGAVAFISVVIIGNTVFTLAIAIVASMAMFELLRMKRIRPFSLMGVISLCIMWILLVPTEWLNIVFFMPVSKAELFLMTILLLLALTVFTKNTFTFDEAGFVILSSVYIGYGFYHFLVARNLEEIGLTLILFILFLIWSTDSGAYFVGKRWGKHKLSPDISPKKTIEGFIGGIVMAAVVGGIFHFFFPIYSSITTLILFIVVTSVFGQLGDLVESALKRHYAVKDSGTVLPGHGGVLDRFDSLIFVMPVLHFFHFF
ncbi:phosphatidate cytidylyltransferase [Alteribacillus persepolensis]|uniref:Phosphatidate cytidylyltransferase n=1 Tax=Alteribacillus persepolensis TaxID=568899 RepID=A0A1G7YRR6_9BACI|nr:phosphatidate cytidylyltransferase [Alteribacillus persepolensis]SDG98936.1 phosphatidate cytidylyltransferase [Alteribacillus persepolensis]